MSKTVEVSPEDSRILANFYKNQINDLSKDLEITLKGGTVNDRDTDDVIDEISNAITEYKYWEKLYD